MIEDSIGGKLKNPSICWGLGGRWGSNPRPSEPQSDALTY